MPEAVPPELATEEHAREAAEISAGEEAYPLSEVSPALSKRTPKVSSPPLLPRAP